MKVIQILINEVLKNLSKKNNCQHHSNQSNMMIHNQHYKNQPNRNIYYQIDMKINKKQEKIYKNFCIIKFIEITLKRQQILLTKNCIQKKRVMMKIYILNG